MKTSEYLQNIRRVANVNPTVARDAYWYAKSVSNGGRGFPLRYTWRQAVTEAHRAGVDLIGLEPHRGPLQVRGAALTVRIREVCARVGIVAEEGEYVEDIAAVSGQTVGEVCEQYGISDLVPEELTDTHDYWPLVRHDSWDRTAEGLLECRSWYLVVTDPSVPARGPLAGAMYDMAPPSHPRHWFPRRRTHLHLASDLRG